MPALKLLQDGGEAIRRHALLWAFPALAQLPTSAWEPCLRRARETEFDGFERAVLVAGVAIAAYLLTPASAQEMPMAAFLHHVAVFLQALPLLGIVVGPAYLRRVRRGLHIEIAAHRAAVGKEVSHESEHR